MKALAFIILAVVASPAGAITFINEDFEDQAFPPTWVQYLQGGEGAAEWTILAGGPWGYYAAETATADEGEYITAGVRTNKFLVIYGTPVLNYSFNYAAAYKGPGLATARFVIESQNKPTLVVPLPRGDWTLKAGTIHHGSGYEVYRLRWELRCIGTSPKNAYLLIDNLTLTGYSYAAVEPTSLGRVKAIYR